MLFYEKRSSGCNSGLNAGKKRFEYDDVEKKISNIYFILYIADKQYIDINIENIWEISQDHQDHLITRTPGSPDHRIARSPGSPDLYLNMCYATYY